MRWGKSSMARWVLEKEIELFLKADPCPRLYPSYIDHLVGVYGCDRREVLLASRRVRRRLRSRTCATMKEQLRPFTDRGPIGV